MSNRALLLAALAVGACGGVSQDSRESIRVCLDLPTAEDNQEAEQAIESWGYPVVLECPSPLIVHVGQIPCPACETDHDPYGWTDGWTEVVWISGPVYDAVRTQWGRLLDLRNTSR